MEPVALIFGLACAGAFAASVRSGSAVAQVLALMLGSIWAGANILWLIDGLAWLCVAELPLALIGYVAWYDGRQRWRAAFAAIYAIRLPVHAMAALGILADIQYKHLINGLFLAALIAIAWEGGIADLVAGCRRAVRRLRLLLAAPLWALAVRSSHR